MKTVLTIEIIDGFNTVQGAALPQNQASLKQQLRDLIPIADKLGNYDAVDYLNSVVFEREIDVFGKTKGIGGAENA